MAHIDHETNTFVDAYGKVVDLSKKAHVMVPRTAGGHTPGWIMDDDYNQDTYVDILLEEPATEPNLIRTKRVKVRDCVPVDTYPFGFVRTIDD